MTDTQMTTCPRCGAEYFALHRGPCPKCGKLEESDDLELFEEPPPGPRSEWAIRITPIELPKTPEEFMVNRRALSVALKEARRRREAGEPRRPEDLRAEIAYAVSGMGYLDPETLDVIEPKTKDDENTESI